MTVVVCSSVGPTFGRSRFDTRECRNYCLGTTTLLVRSTSFHLFVLICLFLCFSRMVDALVCPMYCLLYLLSSIDHAVQQILSIHVSVSILITPTLPVCLSRLNGAFSFNQCFECSLSLTFEYHLHLFILCRTLWTRHHEGTNRVTNSVSAYPHSPHSINTARHLTTMYRYHLRTD